MSLKTFFRRAAEPLPPPAPERTVWAVGDVHGRADLLERLLEQIAPAPGAVVVMVGDYVDRGPDSRGALERLVGRPDTVALMGNHEAMLIDFLDAPEVCGPLWLRNGGSTTLASFGVDLGATDLVAAAASLSAALGPAEAWLRGLPRLWQSGTLVAVHAALDALRPIDRQDPEVLIWGRPGHQPPRADGLWMVHGHTIVPEPYVENGRIGIDTGAFVTGRLTAARIEPSGEIEFVTT